MRQLEEKRLGDDTTIEKQIITGGKEETKDR